MSVHRPDTEALERVRAFLHATFEGATHGAETTSKIVGFAAYIRNLRKRLVDAQLLFSETQSVEDDERFFREAELLFLRRRERFRGGGRGDLIRAWNDVFADATRKVYRDRHDAAGYADDAREMDDDDREFYEATGRIAERS
jgi:hypothetical protein